MFHLPLHYAYYYHVKFGCERNLLQEPFPKASIVLRDLLVFLVIEEIGFYYGHRLMHHPVLYKRFHKMHHEFTAPFGMTGKLYFKGKCITNFKVVLGTYAHPVEHILVNVIPMSAGAILMQSHVLVFAIWLTASIFTVITTHSGFQIPGLPPSIAHDYHHQALNANFGVLGILDTLHGTRGRFHQYLKERTLQR